MLSDEEIGKIWDANVPILNTTNVLVFTRAIEAKVREECAVICEGLIVNADDWDSSYWDQAADRCAEAIRAGGKEDE